MTKIIHKDIQETLYKSIHPSGLTVIVLPKKNFHKTYVTLSTPFGADHTQIKHNEDILDIPLGTAHFLEHKLFDNNGDEISVEFSKNNASVNAYTQNNQTTYLFNCSNHLHKNIHLLLDMVFNPTFTEEGIKKEQTIIDEEIEMYQDEPYTIMYEKLIDQMYFNHPIKNKILGTKDSIREITKEKLERIHQTAYNPKHMILFIVGKVDVDETLTFVNNEVIRPSLKGYSLVDTPIVEPLEVVSNQPITVQHDVYIPHVSVGLKLNPDLFNYSNLKQELVFSILMELLIGKSSDTYQAMVQGHLINDSFDVDVTLLPDASNIIFTCNIQKPDAFREAMNQLVTGDVLKTINNSDFIRVQNQILGGFIYALNSLEYIANQYTKYHFNGDDLFNILTIMRTITIKDIEQAYDGLKKGTLSYVTVIK